MIYVASSWKNLHQPSIVRAIRAWGHEVYDSRISRPVNKSFHWSEIDPEWNVWTPQQHRNALRHPIAKAVYALNIDALEACSACVLVLPSGRSASWELGYVMGARKLGIVVQFEPCEPELMYSEATIVTSITELADALVDICP